MTWWALHSRNIILVSVEIRYSECYCNNLGKEERWPELNLNKEWRFKTGPCVKSCVMLEYLMEERIKGKAKWEDISLVMSETRPTLRSQGILQKPVTWLKDWRCYIPCHHTILFFLMGFVLRSFSVLWPNDSPVFLSSQRPLTLK